MAGRMQNLSSWINQCDQRFQIILVCDSSTDDTSKELAQLKDSQVSADVELLIGDFGSPGMARNAGMQLAKNDWLIFWDSDDIGEPNLLAEKLALVDPKNIDAVVFGYEEHSSMGRMKSWLNWPIHDSKSLDQVSLNPGIWRICFNRHSLGKLEFNNLRMAEDQLFINDFLYLMPKLHFDNAVIYKYFQGIENQLTSNRVALSDIDLALEKLVVQLCGNPASISYTKRIYGKLLFTQLKKGSIIRKAKALSRIILFLCAQPRVATKLVLDMHPMKKP
jgi:glycosyltransferase involved in cell wall biosynthesis